MRNLTQYFQEYTAYHRTRGNEVCHMIGIPMIMVSLLGLLCRLTLTQGEIRVDGGIILWGLATLWYLFLSWRLGAAFSLVALGSYFLGRAIPVPALWVIFSLGWVFQAIGHGVYEKRSPAFVRNFEHLLIGPLWVFARLLGNLTHHSKTLA